jgi:hypothetical protein
MKIRAVSIALVWAAVFFPGKALSQPAARATPRKIGQIFIIGNEVTKQGVILEALGLFPGQVLRAADLRSAEKNLQRLGIFKIDPAKGIRPTVVVLNEEGEGEFKDILVSVEETSTWGVRVMPSLSLQGELGISVVFEERNFDPLRFPTSMDDLAGGLAFRGAYQTFRLELLRFPLLPFRWPSFSLLGSVLLPPGDLSLLAGTVKAGEYRRQAGARSPG